MLRWSLILFDLDGVLIDSRCNMQAAWAEVCRKCGWDIPFARYFAGIGLPFRDILRDLGLDERLDEAEELYAKASIANVERIGLYPGVPAMLAAVRASGSRTGLVTSKDAVRTALLIDRFGFDFDVVQPPAPGLRGKPAPDQLLAAARAVGIGADDTIYVGDMPVDALSARNANMAYAHAEWGYGLCAAGSLPPAELRLQTPDVLVEAFDVAPLQRRRLG